VLGGIIGTIVIKHWDYNGLFLILTAIQALVLLSSGMIEDRIPVNPAPRKQAGEATPMMSGVFLALLAAGVLVSAVHFGSGLGRPLKMNALELSASAIMTTSIISGITGLIVPYLIGWLSDRIERKQLLIVCYSAVMLGTVILIEATALWHFWVSTILFTIGVAGQGVAAALVTDMLPKEALSAGLARYTSTPWLGAAIGYSAGGFLIKALDLDLTFVLLATIPVIAIGLIASVNPRSQIRVTQTQTMVAVSGD
jgi:predicted MFS family arabinose efflux permease